MKAQWKKLIALALAGLLSITACSVPPPAALPAAATPPPAPSPTLPASSPLAATVMGAAERLNAGDLDGYLAYWADDARFYVFGLPTGTEIYAGKEQMRPGFKENIDSHFKEQVEILTAGEDTVTTRTTTWHDFTSQLGVAPLTATETYVIKNGKIASLTWIITSDSLAKLEPALATALPPAPASTPAAREAPASALTVTIADGRCTYDGPMILQASWLTVTLDVKDQDKTLYALTFHTLKPGKTLADLMPETLRGAPPAWAPMAGGTETGRPGSSTTFSMVVSQGPVYAICWSQPPDLPIGTLGPFEVSQ